MRNAWTEKLSSGTSRLFTSSNNSQAPASYGTCIGPLQVLFVCIILLEVILCVFIDLEMTRGLGTKFNFENSIEILNEKVLYEGAV